MQDTVRKDRDKYIGGSDMPIIMGLSPFMTRWELLLDKAGFNDSTFDGNDYTRYGEAMEPVIREYVSDLIGVTYKEDVRISGYRRYHADGYADNTVLEIKTTSQIHETAEEYQAYLTQLQMGIDMFEAQDGILAVYERPEDFDTTFNPLRLQVFFVQKDEKLISDIRKASDAFMNDLEYLKENPLAHEAELPSLTPLVPLAEKAEALELFILEKAEAEKELKAIKAELKRLMEATCTKSWTMEGGTKITLVPDGEDKVVDKFDEKKFKAENPDVWQSYTERTVKKGRTGYVLITPSDKRKSKRALEG